MKTKSTSTALLLSGAKTTILFLLAILIGSLLGAKAPAQAATISDWTDPIILALVSLLFFEVRFQALAKAAAHWRFLSIAWIANFIFIPIIGFAIASLFLSGKPLLFTGLLIYFIAPCTDWFLGFTRMARGNVALGSILIPINLISQILLFPIYLGIFTSNAIGTDVSSLASTLWGWFLLPLLGAIVAHLILSRILPANDFEKILKLTATLIPLSITALIICIFAGNITEIISNPSAFAIILAAVFLFFIATWFLGEFLSRRFKLDHPEHALLAMNTAARNAPLMLGISAAALPNQPLISAAIIIGMLVEFPHLTILTHLLIRRAPANTQIEDPHQSTPLPASANSFDIPTQSPS
jgi:arsenite transporter